MWAGSQGPEGHILGGAAFGRQGVPRMAVGEWPLRGTGKKALQRRTRAEFRALGGIQVHGDRDRR